MKSLTARVYELVEDMRKSGVETFTTKDIRDAARLDGESLPCVSLSTYIDSKPARRRLGIKHVGYEDVPGERGYPVRKVYVFLRGRAADEVWCAVGQKMCRFTFPHLRFPHWSTYAGICLETCADLKDGPWVIPEKMPPPAERLKLKQKRTYERLWNERYGDKDGKDAD